MLARQSRASPVPHEVAGEVLGERRTRSVRQWPALGQPGRLLDGPRVSGSTARRRSCRERPDPQTSRTGRSTGPIGGNPVAPVSSAAARNAAVSRTVRVSTPSETRLIGSRGPPRRRCAGPGSASGRPVRRTRPGSGSSRHRRWRARSAPRRTRPAPPRRRRMRRRSSRCSRVPRRRLGHELGRRVQSELRQPGLAEHRQAGREQLRA